MPKTKCIRCKARFASASGYCAPCRELIEEQNERTQLGAQNGALQAKITRLEAEVAKQRRYTVVTNTNWTNLTWNEAVARADALYEQGIHFLYIRDERGTKVREWKIQEGAKVIA